ncbi:MAG: hypothetical protein ACI9FU_000002 [Granulosicoccus sp.]
MRFNLLNIVFVVLTLLVGSEAMAQKYSTRSKKAIKHFEAGDKAFNAMRMEDAKASYQKAAEIDPKFINAHIMLGDVYEEMKDLESAVACYETVNKIDNDYYRSSLMIQAELELKLGRYADAHLHLTKFMAKKGLDPRALKKAEQLMITASYGKEGVKNPVPFDPINLGENINSSDYEYFPSLTVDGQTLIYTRNRRVGPVGFQEDFYLSKLKNGEWLPSINLGPPVNTTSNEGAQAISVDGQHLFFTGCNRKNGEGSCDIYYSKKEGGKWSAAENIGPPVNSSKWESQPSFSSDGRTLYFSSNRPGGHGKSDLWYSKLTPEGRWTPPVNLGDVINTSGYEESPYIHPDNRTLYFASTGHPGYGQKDIFYTKKDELGNWSAPKNLGYPINTWEEEIGLIVDAVGRNAYFSSGRDGGHGKLDILSFELYDDARPIPVTYMKGIVKNAVNNRPIKASFELIDLETKEVVARSFSDATDGGFMVCLPVNRDYALNVSKDGFLFHSEHFELTDMANSKKPFIKNVDLNPIKYGESVVLRNIFFETASFQLLPTSSAELDKLVGFLGKNVSMNIEIGGHTDDVGKDSDNQVLSDKRSESVKQYLVDHGIHPTRLSHKGYGETKPVADNSTEEGRALNRRTEFTVLE